MFDGKVCCCCSLEKEKYEFSKDKSRKDGYSNRCKKCDSLKSSLYQENNKEKYRKTQNLNRNKRLKDITFKLTCYMRTRIYIALKKEWKSGSTIELLGCSIDELKIWLQSKFTPEMSWDNYGSYWHVDHIRPCASFDLSKESEQRKCFHYTNLQPLEASENIRKKDKYVFN